MHKYCALSNTRPCLRPLQTTMSKMAELEIIDSKGLPLIKGDYCPAGPGHLRAPCPVLNSLANHGIIARSGRNITAAELKAALRYLGMGIDVITILVNGAFKVHSDDPKKGALLGLRDKDLVDERRRCTRAEPRPGGPTSRRGARCLCNPTGPRPGRLHACECRPSGAIPRGSKNREGFQRVGFR